MRTLQCACAALVVAAAPLWAQESRGTPLPLPRATQRAHAVADAAMRNDLATVRTLLAQHADVNAPQPDGMTALHWAAERGNRAMVDALLKARADLRAVTRIGAYTPLHVAAKSRNADVVKALLRAGADPNVANANGATAMHFAAASGSADAIDALADAGAKVDAREAVWGQTPLMFAAAADRGAAITALLARGADASIHSRSLNITEAAAQEQAATRRRNEVILSFKPQSVRDSIAAAAAVAAATPRQAGGGTEAPPPGGAPAGAGGTGGGGGRGAQVSTDGLTPAQIQEAIIAGRNVLTGAPARTTVEEDTTDGQVAGYAGTVGSMGGLTALHHAVRQGNLDAVAALLAGGADVNEPIPSDSTTPLLLATINGQFDVALKLIEAGANVNAPSTAGATPLYGTLNTQWSPRSRFPQPQAVQNQKTSYLELMKVLLDKGADPNVRIKRNLWYFAYNNCGNAQCGLENLEGTNAFWRAAYAVDVEAMRLLVKYGADYKTPSQRTAQTGHGGGRGRGGRAATPATAAGSASATTVAQNTGRGGRGGGGGDDDADRDASRLPLDPATDSAARAVPPGIGVYPIHCAAGVGYGNGFAGNSHRHAPDGWMPAMKYLVEELGADVDARDPNGYTPLHHAAARGDNEMILYLVSKGADVKAVARNGRTTVDMANGPVSRISPIPATIALLEKLGAKNSHRCASC